MFSYTMQIAFIASPSVRWMWIRSLCASRRPSAPGAWSATNVWRPPSTATNPGSGAEPPGCNERRSARPHRRCPRPVTWREHGYLIPNLRPNFARRPDRVVGMPVARVSLRFAAVIPSARFHENDSPGPSLMVCLPRFVVDVRSEPGRPRVGCFGLLTEPRMRST